MNTQLRVLIVEDSESDARLIARQLQRAGYDLGYERVETAEAMQTALAQQEWDLVIADYNLPRFSGPAALEIFKARASGYSVYRGVRHNRRGQGGSHDEVRGARLHHEG